MTQDRAWTLSAAETIGATNYAVDLSADRLYVWEMDSNWNFVRDSQTAVPGTSAYNAIEADFNLDFNGDGTVGHPSRTTVEAEGSVELQVDGNNKTWVSVGSDLFQINRSGWGHVIQDRGAWTLSAAETIGGTTIVDVWLVGCMWEMDSNWNFVRDSQTAVPCDGLQRN